MIHELHCCIAIIICVSQGAANVFISCKAVSCVQLYCGALGFCNSKNLNCIGALSFVHSFSRFLKSNWSSDFGHAETGSGAKKRVVLRREIFSL